MADRVLVPPLNFAMVEPGVYRSGYPNKKNFPFLKKLGLKSVMYICEDDYTDENLRFWDETGVRVFHVRVAGNKEPFGEIDEADIADALSKVLSVDNQPILLHCNKGKHRVGCLVGCLRKLQRWSLAAIFDEYRRFSGSKMHIADQEFIEVFDAPPPQPAPAAAAAPGPLSASAPQKLPAPSQGHPTEPQTATLPKPPEQQPDAASQPAATAAPFDKLAAAPAKPVDGKREAIKVQPAAKASAMSSESSTLPKIQYQAQPRVTQVASQPSQMQHASSSADATGKPKDPGTQRLAQERKSDVGKIRERRNGFCEATWPLRERPAAQSNCLGNTGKAIDSWSLGKRASAGQDQVRECRIYASQSIWKQGAF
ncbi:tyrosine-protein phosphatase siw14 [Polyrhizophydium stewartii]|uniref:Tyrosine-protein phosphatase siw14 n=1 Tax=Polyrhizophydium stewartii TaxID=2732419 RepID=A0ABR4NJB6_9FUNG